MPALVVPNVKDVAVPVARLRMENLPQDQGVFLRAGQAAWLLQALCRKPDCFSILLLLTPSLPKIKLAWKELASSK